MSELELRLSALGQEVEYPSTPDLAAAVMRSLESGPAPARRRSRRRVLAVALAVALAAAAGVLAFSPGARSAFLELFRLQGATVTKVESLPEVDLITFDLGERVDREEAERRVGFELVDLGEPDAIYVRADRVATLVYGPPRQPRLVLSQLDGAVWDGFHKKAAGTGTKIEDVTVDGQRGLFISGNEHYVMFMGADGFVTDEQTALAGNTLLWNRGTQLLRLEGDLSRDEALELAESVR